MSRIHWVTRVTGTPKDRDEVNKREVSKCVGDQNLSLFIMFFMYVVVYDESIK